MAHPGPSRGSKLAGLSVAVLKWGRQQWVLFPRCLRSTQKGLRPREEAGTMGDRARQPEGRGGAASAVLCKGHGRGENPEISEGWGGGQALASTPRTALRHEHQRRSCASARGETPAGPTAGWPAPPGRDRSSKPCQPPKSGADEGTGSDWAGLPRSSHPLFFHGEQEEGRMERVSVQPT